MHVKALTYDEGPREGWDIDQGGDESMEQVV